MTAMRSIKMIMLTAAAACVLVATVGATAAHAESAWWGLTSQPRPTYLKPGLTEGGVGRRDEVQEITGTPSPLTHYLVFELEVENKIVGKFWNQSFPEPANGFEPATAEKIEAALDAAYGAGNVEVTGGPVATAPVTVTSVNGKFDKPVAPIALKIYRGLSAYYGNGEAKVITEGSAGKSSGQAVVATIANIGEALVSGATSPVVITDTLPAGIEAYEVEAWVRGQGKPSALACSGTGKTVECSDKSVLPPFTVIEMTMPVNAAASAVSGANTVDVSGGQLGECRKVTPGAGEFLEGDCLAAPLGFQGEAAPEFDLVPIAGATVAPNTLAQQLTVSREPMPFGVEQFEMKPEAEGGELYDEAGGHPFQLTTTVVFNTGAETLHQHFAGSGGREFDITQPATAKTLTFKLPRGFIGNPTVFPQCPDKQFSEEVGSTGGSNRCPADTAVGVAIVGIDAPPAGNVTGGVPVFNLVPEHGEPARFGFEIGKAPVTLDTSVRTGNDYSVTVTVHDINQTAGYIFSEVTLWGIPGLVAHRLARGNECRYADTAPYRYGACERAQAPASAPFLILPTMCAASPAAEPLVSGMEGDSWAAFEVPSQTLKPISYTFQNAFGEPVGLTGCNGLDFEPSIKETVPDVKDASTPTGLTVDVHVPQDAGLNPSGVADSEVKQIEVTLPEGVTVNPGGADGLQACSEEQIGFKGPNQSAVGGFEFTEKLPEPLEPGVNFCPNQSKIATVRVHTPLLPNPLEGFVYLATPSINGEVGDNPYESMIAMYLVAHDPISGVLVKLPMHVYLCEKTGETVAKSTCEAPGQLVTTVENPELPFEDAELHFFGGSRAPLLTPALCGTYTTNAVFTPWSGNAAVDSSAQFTIDTGPNGSPCFPSPRPFTPGFEAGSANIQAAAYTPFTTTLGHPDGDQPLAAVTLKMPPGLMGSLSGVTLCPEPQASLGTCGPESLIGHTVVTAGLGSNPAVVARPGNVYITGPYKGAPFGLSIANPAETGPFDLEKGTPCDCVVVRAKVEVNPHTAQLTVTSDPLPTILKGIPLLLQHVNVTIDRPSFMFNPTNCAKMAIGGTIGGGEGASAPVSTSFQVANCATLPFKPGFSVLTSAKHTRNGGDGLHVVVISSYGQANIAKVHVELPKVLPSRLTTLQKACTEAQFDSNPAGCPSASIVGRATIHTSLVPVPLTGPAYFVSHGGARFPELVMVVQGYGITVDLSGETFISKKGITSSSFNSTPDVPFNRFDLVLPAGNDSALTGIGDLCAHPLYMPTTLTGQNGAVVKQRTRIAVTGCGPELLVLRHHVKGATATIVVRTPSAGRLVASGRFLSRAVKRLGKAGVATLTLTLSKAEQAVLARHRGRRLKAGVELRFTPGRGHVLTRAVTVLLG